MGTNEEMGATATCATMPEQMAMDIPDREPASMQNMITSRDVIEVEGELYMTARRVGEKLGYKYPHKDVMALYRKHHDEINGIARGNENSSPLLHLAIDSEGGKQKSAAFHERAVYVLAMLARTKVACAFRMALSRFLEQHRRDRQERQRLEQTEREYRLRAETNRQIAACNETIATRDARIAELEKALGTIRDMATINVTVPVWYRKIMGETPQAHER